MDGASAGTTPTVPPSFQREPDKKTEMPTSQSLGTKIETTDQFASIFDVKPKASTKFTKDNISDATELTKIALRALEKKNGALAVERLRAALSCLEQG